MHARITYFAISVLLLVLLSLYPTLQFPSSEQVSTFIGPRAWPLGLLFTLFLLSAALLIITWHDARRNFVNDPPTETSRTDRKRSLSLPDSIHIDISLSATRHWWVIIATIGYTLLMEAIGFLIASVIFTVVIMLLLGAFSKKAILINIVVVIALMQGLFFSLLSLPLP